MHDTHGRARVYCQTGDSDRVVEEAVSISQRSSDVSLDASLQSARLATYVTDCPCCFASLTDWHLPCQLYLLFVEERCPSSSCAAVLIGVPDRTLHLCSAPLFSPAPRRYDIRRPRYS
jgi:hypothetical protein